MTDALCASVAVGGVIVLGLAMLAALQAFCDDDDHWGGAT